MTLDNPRYARLVELDKATVRERLPEALDIYVAAMGYSAAAGRQRAPVWLGHMARPGWRCVGAFDHQGMMIGICYGYQGRSGYWWDEQVRRGLAAVAGPAATETWLRSYFELTELHVRPNAQGKGIGEDLLRATLSNVPDQRVLLSTPEGPTRAWRLYYRLGFTDVLRNYRFAGDSRPFGVLGRSLPL